MGIDYSDNLVEEDTTQPDEIPEKVESSGISYGDNLTEEPQPSGNKSRVAYDPSNVFEPMPEEWNKEEYPLGEYGDALRRRDWEVMQSNKDKASGEINFATHAWQDFTKGFVGKAVDTLDYLVIKPVLKNVSEAMEEFGGAVARSLDAGDGAVAFDMQTGKAVRDYIQDNQEELGKWWMTLDKQTRKNIEGTGLLVSIMPASFSTKPVKVAGELATGALRVARKGLVTSLAKEKTKSAMEMIIVPRSKMTAQEKFNHQNNTSVDGVYKPSSNELAEIRAVENLPNFKTKSTLEQRDWVINDGVNKQSVVLDDILKKEGTVINPERVRESMDSALDEKIYQNTTFSGVAELDKKGLAEGGRGGIIETMRAKAETAISKAVNENNGILDSHTLNKARQSFDNAVTEEKYKWSSDDYSINDEVWLAVRKGMNDVIDDSTVNKSVKARRENVSRLISARNKSNLVLQEKKVDHIFRKAFHAISGVGRTQYMGQILANAAGAVGAVTLAGGVKGSIATAAVVGGVGLGVTWVGSKIVMSRTGRKAILATITELDEAVKLAKTAAQKITIIKAKKDMIDLLSTATLVTGGVAARNKEENNDK